MRDIFVKAGNIKLQEKPGWKNMNLFELEAKKELLQIWKAICKIILKKVFFLTNWFV